MTSIILREMIFVNPNLGVKNMFFVSLWCINVFLKFVQVYEIKSRREMETLVYGWYTVSNTMSNFWYSNNTTLMLMMLADTTVLHY